MRLETIIKKTVEKPFKEKSNNVFFRIFRQFHQLLITSVSSIYKTLSIYKILTEMREHNHFYLKLYWDVRLNLPNETIVH